MKKKERRSGGDFLNTFEKALVGSEVCEGARTLSPFAFALACTFAILILNRLPLLQNAK